MPVQVIWYDSVTVKGDLKWQNELNAMNHTFFDLCDGTHPFLFSFFTHNRNDSMADEPFVCNRRHTVLVVLTFRILSRLIRRDFSQLLLDSGEARVHAQEGGPASGRRVRRRGCVWARLPWGRRLEHTGGDADDCRRWALRSSVCAGMGL